VEETALVTRPFGCPAFRVANLGGSGITAGSVVVTFSILGKALKIISGALSCATASSRKTAATEARFSTDIWAAGITALITVLTSTGVAARSFLSAIGEALNS
jgi:hypothetical protein